MKVAELREKIHAYTRQRLERIILEMYKATPKSVREMNGIDSLIINLDARRAKPRVPVRRDMEDIRAETEDFVSNAYNQFYYAPNSVVPKSKRSRWRFTARRLFKELNKAADSSTDAPAAAELLKSLYEMLCYSCRYILFSGYDSFASVGIPQVDFFRAVLVVKRKIESPREFVRNSILLALASTLNRYTLWDELLEVVVAFLETVDLKEMAIEICDDLRKEAAANQLKNLEPFKDGLESYQTRDFVNHLAILGWMCHMALDQPDGATRYFHQHYKEKDAEIALYVLLRMIKDRGCWDLWMRTYQEAVDNGIQPREELQRQSKDIQDKFNIGRFP